MNRSALRVVIGFWLSVVTLVSQTHEENWQQVCARAVAEPLTPPIFARPDNEKNLHQCDSTALYYGFGQRADPAAALQCAWYQRAHPRPGDGNPFYGPGVLTMIDANGMGVARDFHLAIRFACENTWAAQAEMSGRTAHLEKLRDAAATAQKPFDLCDDATSGLMEGACESVRQHAIDAKRSRDLAVLSAAWSTPVREAFKKLMASELAFNAARTGNEIDLSGTARGALTLAEDGRLRDQLLINLQRFAKGDVPAASPADYQKVAQDVDTAYQRIEQSPANAWEFGTVKPAGIREGQAAWFKLREGWVDFTRVAYPSLPADTVRTQIARLRLHQLQSLLP